MKTTAKEQWVVVQNGQRVGKTFESQQEAMEEAKKLRKLNETSGQAKTDVNVCQNLMG